MLNVRDRSVWSPTDYALWFQENPPHRLETWDAALVTISGWCMALTGDSRWQHFHRLVEKANTTGGAFTFADATLGAAAISQGYIPRLGSYGVTGDGRDPFLILAERCWDVLDDKAPGWSDDAKPVGDVGQAADSAPLPEWSSFRLTNDDIGEVWRQDPRTVKKNNPDFFDQSGRVRLGLFDDMTQARIRKLLDEKPRKAKIPGRTRTK